MLKRTLTLILSLIFVLCVCGCSNNVYNASSDTVEYIYEVETEHEGESGDLSNSDVHIDNNQSDSSSSNNSETNSSLDSKPATDKDQNTVEQVDLRDDIIKAYLSAKNATQQFQILNEYSNTFHDSQNVTLSWNSDGSSQYTVLISENADFSNPYIIEVSQNNVNPGVLVPGKTYYWRVTGKKSPSAIAGGKIAVNNRPVRFVDIEGVGNVRDLGGWTTESGKTVAYGKLYRGRQLNNITTQGISALKYLGMKTEIDIRSENNNPSATDGTGLNYKFFNTTSQYDKILNDDHRERVTTNFKAIFALLADENNYPMYIHCTAGADRTGTLAFLVNGYLGVSYEDLTRDFELTSFSASGKRWRGAGNGGTFAENDTVMQNDNKNYVAWGELYNRMMSEYGTGDGKLSSAIENYLVNYIGVPKSQLESIKSIMLGYSK